MYPRIVKSLLKASTKLNSERTLKTTTLIFSNVILSMQTKVPCIVIPRLCTRYFSSDSDNGQHKALPIDPLERKDFIDKSAQKKIDEILKNNPEMEKFMKIIELEISIRKQDGERVPSTLRPRDWVEMLKLKGPLQRKKFLNYLFIIEKKEEKQKSLQIERNLALEQAREERKLKGNNEILTNEIIYGMAHNSLFRRVHDATMSKAWNWNAVKATMFGNKIVFDFSFEHMMSYRELKSCAKQILECHAINRQHNFPFDVYLCNVNFNGELIERVNRFIPTLFEGDFPFHITSKSYLDLFEQSNLIYLSSDASKVLETYDPNMIYIIGALVDRGDKVKASLAKAKQENLQRYKLPLDLHAKFGHGSGKDLTLNQVFAIMLDAQNNDWEKAMAHVPKRKLYESRLRLLERKVQRQIYFSRSQAEKKDEENVPIARKLDFESDMPKYNLISKSISNSEKNFPNQDCTKQETSNRIHSSAIHEFSNAARRKLRKQWNK